MWAAQNSSSVERSVTSSSTENGLNPPPSSCTLVRIALGRGTCIRPTEWFAGKWTFDQLDAVWVKTPLSLLFLECTYLCRQLERVDTNAEAGKITFRSDCIAADIWDSDRLSTSRSLMHLLRHFADHRCERTVRLSTCSTGGGVLTNTVAHASLSCDGDRPQVQAGCCWNANPHPDSLTFDILLPPTPQITVHPSPLSVTQYVIRGVISVGTEKSYRAVTTHFDQWSKSTGRVFLLPSTMVRGSHMACVSCR